MSDYEPVYNQECEIVKDEANDLTYDQKVYKIPVEISIELTGEQVFALSNLRRQLKLSEIDTNANDLIEEILSSYENDIVMNPPRIED